MPTQHAGLFAVPFVVVLGCGGADPLGARPLGVPVPESGSSASDPRGPGDPNAEPGAEEGVDSSVGGHGLDAGLLVPLEPAARRALDEIVGPLIDMQGASGKTVGLALAVVGPGYRDVLGYGATTRGGTTRPGSETLFEIGSVTKVITGLLLAQEVLAGVVALDDPVSRYLPADAVVPALGRSQITLEHLVTHTAGLPNMPTNLLGSPPNPADGYTPELLYEFLRKFRLSVEPGTRYVYSNVGIGVLGHALSRHHGGTPFEALLTERTLSDLGMADTGITLAHVPESRRARGHQAGRSVIPNAIGTLEAAGALRSTGRDMLAFMEANLSPSAELAPAIALLQTPRARGGPAEGDQLGLGLVVREQDGARVFEKSGATGGFASFIKFSAERKKGVAVLANERNFAAAELAAAIFARLPEEP